MRIALFHNLSSGGAKRTLYETTRRLSQQHLIDVYTLTSADHEFADLRPYVASHTCYEFQPLPILKYPFGRFNQLVRLYNLVRVNSLSKKIAREIEKADYDLFLTHPCRITNSPSVLQHFKGKNVVYYCQEPPRVLYEVVPFRPYDKFEGGKFRKFVNTLDPFPPLFTSTLKQIDVKNTTSADLVLVNSKYEKETVKRIYQVDARVSYHGIDVDFFQDKGFEKDDFVLSVGSLTSFKGFDFIIQSLGLIPEQKRPPLVIASNMEWPPERAYLENMAKEAGVRVTFKKNVSDEDLIELYNKARVTLYTPYREPFGLVPLESMACGTPVVGVSEGGVRETILHEQNGLLVERNPQEFARAVEKLYFSPALAEEYGRNGKAHVNNYWTWDRAVSDLEKHLFDCLGV
jgi:glycosyltransferase involved in cell wall biosynthesis